MGTLTLDDRIRAERLKQQIRELERARIEIDSRFATYSQSSVEEQRATRLALDENRVLIGRLSQELLRLVCL